MKLEHICQQCLTQPWIHLLVFRAHLLFAVVTRLLWELQIVIYCWEFIEWSFKYLNLPCVPIKLCNKMFNPLRTLNYFLMCLYSVTNCKLCILCDAKYVFKQLKKSVVCKRKKKRIREIVFVDLANIYASHLHLLITPAIYWCFTNNFQSESILFLLLKANVFYFKFFTSI